MDRRIKYTRNIIETTFIDLLKEKEISKITVSEVCNIADVNRATFYRYYLDLNDLLYQIEEKFIKDLVDKLEESKTDNINENLLNLLKVLENNKKLVSIIFTPNPTNEGFLQKLVSIIRNVCKTKWTETLPSITKDEIEYGFTFIFSGSYGIVRLWIKNNFNMPVEELASTIEVLYMNGIKKYIYEK